MHMHMPEKVTFELPRNFKGQDICTSRVTQILTSAPVRQVMDVKK